MSDVYTTILAVPKTYRNKRIYGEGSTFIGTTVDNPDTNSIVVPKDIFKFTASALPTITDYNTLYAPAHGQYPRLDIIIDNGDGTRYQKQQMPQFTTLTSGGGLDDLIDTIRWDFGEALTGWIIIN
jgi:hypothetical protein